MKSQRLATQVPFKDLEPYNTKAPFFMRQFNNSIIKKKKYYSISYLFYLQTCFLCFILIYKHVL